MYLIAVATDYDGTLAQHGNIDAPTIAALERLKASGRKLLMVTGRELSSLKCVFDRFDLFDVIVAENGSLLYFPQTQEERLVAGAPPPELIEALQARGVQPLSVGRGIVATWEPNEAAVLESIRDLGLEWQIIFNKGAVMVLPPGVNKSTGLSTALDAMELSPFQRRTVSVEKRRGSLAIDVPGVRVVRQILRGHAGLVHRIVDAHLIGLVGHVQTNSAHRLACAAQRSPEPIGLIGRDHPRSSGRSLERNVARPAWGGLEVAVGRYAWHAYPGSRPPAGILA